MTQLIEGAKKEAKVSTTLTDNLTEQGVQRLRKEIKEKFGVDLEIQFEPVGSYSARLPQAIAQYKAEVTPTFDLMQSNDLLIRRYIDAAVIEKPDWGPLLAEGTPREVIMWDGYALSTQTSHIGMIFDPKVVPPADAPKSLSDLANPRWRGKFIGLSAPSSYVSYAFVRGVDRTLSDLRAMIKNEPVIETYARALTRYSAGEYPIAMISSNYHENARQQGVSVEWRSLDMSYLSVIGVMVLKRAAHPNAAKLVAAYLASPAGHKLILEEAKNGSALHPGNPEFEKHQQDVKAGLPLFNPTQWPGAADFLLSEKGQQLEKEIAEILKGG
ncbi:MAG: extracellular solute-binding protein [Chloroflexi bacterium]|nr:extracellular solute-binding protein [Chloroflexota bacterium]